MFRHYKIAGTSLGAASAGTGLFAGLIYRSDAERLLLVLVFITVFCDWVTGIAASYKEGIPIKSKRMREAIPKLIGYMAFVVMTVVSQEVIKTSGLKLPDVPLLCGSLALIFAVEAHSCFENIFRLTEIRNPILERILKGLPSAEKPEPKIQKERS